MIFTNGKYSLFDKGLMLLATFFAFLNAGIVSGYLAFLTWVPLVVAYNGLAIVLDFEPSLLKGIALLFWGWYWFLMVLTGVMKLISGRED